jgi:antitoxin ParD1/3/4
MLEITPDIGQIVEAIKKHGQYESESAVLREALPLLQQRDRLRRDILEGVTELDRGECIPGEEVFQGLEEQIIRLNHD